MISDILLLQGGGGSLSRAAGAGLHAEGEPEADSWSRVLSPWSRDYLTAQCYTCNNSALSPLNVVVCHTDTPVRNCDEINSKICFTENGVRLLNYNNSFETVVGLAGLEWTAKIKRPSKAEVMCQNSCFVDIVQRDTVAVITSSISSIQQ